MDPVYGEPKFYSFGSYWHTMEDTPDKVSAESLAHVGRLVELGLRTNAFVSIGPLEEQNLGEATNNITVEPSDEPQNEESRALFVIATVGLVSTVGLLVLVESKGKQ
jgi:hypothetical protein